ncbi:hypothetical protein QNO07_21595 [Streptomyces sp. 549]|uniref:hypothetical protein n=1 Tax=Streptomyces sp. 549 TaxID=3049076 RepID=UPI0024C3C726|nr:hypothetical protein [Streptomyces sp. 549]MDK1475979.1 hypothetical protein [Streptomyces sp. 549]
MPQRMCGERRYRLRAVPVVVLLALAAAACTGGGGDGRGAEPTSGATLVSPAPDPEPVLAGPEVLTGHREIAWLGPRRGDGTFDPGPSTSEAPWLLVSCMADSGTPSLTVVYDAGSFTATCPSEEAGYSQHQLGAASAGSGPIRVRAPKSVEWFVSLQTEGR